jgi:hypothetical protein
VRAATTFRCLSRTFPLSSPFLHQPILANLKSISPGLLSKFIALCAPILNSVSSQKRSVLSYTPLFAHLKTTAQSLRCPKLSPTHVIRLLPCFLPRPIAFVPTEQFLAAAILYIPFSIPEYPHYRPGVDRTPGEASRSPHQLRIAPPNRKPPSSCSSALVISDSVSPYLFQLNHSSSLSKTQPVPARSVSCSTKPDCKHRASSAAHIRGHPFCTEKETPIIVRCYREAKFLRVWKRKPPQECTYH